MNKIRISCYVNFSTVRVCAHAYVCVAVSVHTQQIEVNQAKRAAIRTEYIHNYIFFLQNVTSIGTPNAVVFPYGSAEWKQNKAEAVTTPMEAKAKAVATLPDLTQKLSASTLNDFLMTCYMPSPSKFPAILLTSKNIHLQCWKLVTIQWYI